eukprot:2668033-Pyramimonas_sp.AAC.1
MLRTTATTDHTVQGAFWTAIPRNRKEGPASQVFSRVCVCDLITDKMEAAPSLLEPGCLNLDA